MADKFEFRASVPVAGKLRHVGMWKWEAKQGSSLENLANIYSFARTAMQELDAKKSDLSRSGRFTEQGIAAELAAHGLEFHKKAGNLRRNIIEPKLKALSKEAQDLIGVKPRERDDLAGQLADREIRDWFRTQDPEARSHLLSRLTAGEHQEVTQALLRGSPLLTGLAESTWSALNNVMVPEENRAKLSEISEEAEAAQLAGNALDAAAGVVNELSGLNPLQAQKASAGEAA